MTDKYEEMSLEELKELKAKREKEKLVEAFKLDEVEKLKARDAAIVEEAIAKYKAENPEPDVKLSITPTTELAATKAEWDGTFIDPKFAVEYAKRNKLNIIEYSNEEWTMPYYEHTNSDSGCDDTLTAWIPADVYANVIWTGMYEKADLLSICVKGIDVKAGDGLSIQIRTIGKRTAPSSAAACECISCVSQTFSSYSLTVGRYADYAVLCGLDEFSVGARYASSVIDSMRKSWAELFNSTIYSELETASPGNSQTLAAVLSGHTPSGSCCTVSDLYASLIALEADMREDDYSPDTIILSPSVAAYFKFPDGLNFPPWVYKAAVIKDGRLASLDGMRVIEYSGANSVCTTASEVMAIMIDSSRAVGCVFGKRPKLEKERDIECDSVKLVMNCYFGCSELDTNAIGQILNP